MNDKLLRMPFCTCSSGTLYSFIIAGNTVKGPQVSATMPIATVADIHTKLPRATKFPLLTAHPQLSLLNLEIIEQSCNHIVWANRLSNVSTSDRLPPPRHQTHLAHPKVFTAARRMPFFCALRSSNRSKQIRFHSLGGARSAPRSAIRPIRSMPEDHIITHRD